MQLVRGEGIGTGTGTGTGGGACAGYFDDVVG
jgi:hypothetical protein